MLGLLRESPVHGYELRKQLALRLGGLRAYSYGSLYPALRRLTRAGFGVHLAFFSRTPTETRMRILEGRRRAVEERREGMRAALAKANEQIDRYTRQLQQLGLDACEREVRWLNELIDGEHTDTKPDRKTDTQ